MKKWAHRALAVVAVLVVALAGAVLWSAERTAHPVGLAVARVAGAAKPFPVVIWYPTSGTAWPTTQLGITLMSVVRDGPVDGRQLPLVVVSHGNGGGPGSHADLALALADAGYVVAAPMHAGDNLEDSTGAPFGLPCGNRFSSLRASSKGQALDTCAAARRADLSAASVMIRALRAERAGAQGQSTASARRKSRNQDDVTAFHRPWGALHRVRAPGSEGTAA